MRFVRPAALIAALFSLTAVPVQAEGVPGFTATDKPLIEQRGLPMSAQDAMERITFHPFVPSPNYAEVALLPARDTTFPSASQLGIPRPATADPAGIRDIAQRLLRAERPYIVVSSSGRDPKTVPALVELCELLALPVVTSAFRAYHCFPMNHPLNLGAAKLSDADVVVALDANVPYVPGPAAPPASAYVAVIDPDPVRAGIPTYEFTADLRLTAGALGAIGALTEAVRATMSDADRGRIAERRARYDKAFTVRMDELERDAQSRANKTPIDELWLSHEIGKFVDDDTIVLDETLPHNQVERYLKCSVPGSYIANPASSGGYTSGAALGVKLAKPDKHVIAITGDGFYMFSTANAALLAGRMYGAPFTIVVYQNGAYSTGTLQVSTMYPDSFSKKVGYEGGTFGAIDFAKEAEACGAYGENVTDPSQIGAALKRAREANDRGLPAVIAVRVEPLY